MGNISIKTSKLLFIHIPKNAGCSVRSFIRSTKRKYGHELKHSIKEKGHALFKANYEHPLVTNQFYDYSFCFFRNPFQRVVSAYFYLSEYQKRNRYDVKCYHKYIKPSESFEDFVLNGHLKRAVQNKQIHFLPQIFWIKDHKRNLFPDFIGLVNTIECDIKKICKLIGVSCHQFPHKNKTNYNYWFKYYNTNIYDKIKMFYEEDIRIYEFILTYKIMSKIIRI